MKRGYNRRRIQEPARPKASSVDKRVLCPNCDVSLTLRHYEQYHRHYCQKRFEGKKAKCLPSTSEQSTKIFNESETTLVSTVREETVCDVEASVSQVLPSSPEVVHANDLKTKYLTIEIQETPSNHDHVTNLSTHDIEMFFPKGGQDIEPDDNREAQLWLETEEESIAQTMEEAIAQDLDEVVQQVEARPITLQTKALRFIQWFCLGLMVWQARYFISDVAIDAWLSFLKNLLSVFAEPGGLLGIILTLLPSGVYGVNKVLQYAKDPFTKFVVCRKCYTLYSVSECVQIIEGRAESGKCTFLKYRWQKNALQRNACNEKLLKEVILPSGKRKLYPFKWFCYRSLKSCLAEMVMRLGFEELCERWRERNVTDGVMEDIMDGEIWKEFNGAKYNFFTQERCYGLMLNIDWFRPFKHVQYSVGAIYLTIMNLPKSERFKRKNVILLGIIPHMGTEPKTNTFLYCLTQELIESWDHGFNLESARANAVCNFRLALVMVGCDIPACRKVCGFLGHAAYRGCSKCWKYFGGKVGERDYSGFIREEWPERSHAKHMEASQKILDGKRKTEVEMLEREYGLRYSVLLELPYFDIVRMHIVDPMHNLFLGTAKRMVEIWKDRNILSNDDMKCIQQRIDRFEVPSDLGNIPYKIQSGFADFSADQWKNWTLYFSVPCLQGILPARHLNVWKHFVKASYLLCSHVMAAEMLLEADTELLKFCTSFETLYGPQYVTPNMHLHGHLRDCVLLYGPIYSFWLFSFERYNGILGKQPSNQRSVEVQMMRRFVKDGLMFSKCLKSTDEEKKITECLLKMSATRSRGALKDMVACDFLDLCRASSCQSAIDALQISTENIVSYMTKEIWDLTPPECLKLKEMYTVLYPTLDFTVAPSCFKVRQLLFSGDVLGTKDSRSSRCSFIMAYWPDQNGRIQTDSGNYHHLAAGQILYIIEHNILFTDGSFKKHVIARVLWYQEMEPQLKDFYGFPVHIFHSNIYRPESNASFIPIQRIRCRMLKKTETLKFNLRTRDVLIAVPRDHFAGFP